MRIWVLLTLAAVCVVAGMMIYVPQLEYQHTFVGEEPTAPPMENITMADRDVNLTFMSPLGDFEAEAIETVSALNERTLLFDASLTGGLADLYPTQDGLPVLIDIASGKWNKAAAAAVPDRPQVWMSGENGTIASVLRIEAGVLVLGGEDPAFLRLYSGDGEELLRFEAQSLSPDLAISPMANPDCAYIAKIDSSALLDAQTGEVTAVAAPGRPVWLERADRTLMMERGGDYVVRELSSGGELTYRLVY